jgi:hypothetical protein
MLWGDFALPQNFGSKQHHDSDSQSFPRSVDCTEERANLCNAIGRVSLDISQHVLGAMSLVSWHQKALLE